MDRKLLMKVVLFVLLIHILVIGFYINSHDTNDFIMAKASDRFQNILTRGFEKGLNPEGTKIVSEDHEIKIDDFGKFSISSKFSKEGDYNKPTNERNTYKASDVANFNTNNVIEGGDRRAKDLFHDNDNNIVTISDDVKSDSKNVDGSSILGAPSISLSSSLSSSSSSSASSSRPSSSTLIMSPSSSSSSSSLPLSSSSSSPSSLREIKSPQPTIQVPSHRLQDESHPQYDRAFARNTRPGYMLKWKPSPDSAQYFRKVEGTNAYMYSAYMTNCTPPSVTLVGISPRNKIHLGVVFCHYLDGQWNLLESQRGSMRAFKDSHQLDHTAAFVECPITAGLEPRFATVTKTGQYTKQSNSFIPVQYAPEKPARNFTLCFSPFHSYYNYTFQLIQSIELNRLLGASHFVFYNFSTTPQTDEILRYYEGQGLATILPWPLPHLESWYFAQIAAINDCINRNKMTSRYVVIVDTDEFVVPQVHSSWLDLLNDVTHSPSLRENYKGTYSKGYKTCTVLNTIGKNNRKDLTSSKSQQFGSFMFRCSFFAEKPLTSIENEILKAKNMLPTQEQTNFFRAHHSHPMLYLKRNDVIYKHESRSKLIVRPETVVSHAIHKTVEHLDGYGTAYVNTTAAYLHHYHPYKIKTLNTLETSALKYKDQLYERLRAVIKNFPTIFTDEITEKRNIENIRDVSR